MRNPNANKIAEINIGIYDVNGAEMIGLMQSERLDIYETRRILIIALSKIRDKIDTITTQGGRVR